MEKIQARIRIKQAGSRQNQDKIVKKQLRNRLLYEIMKCMVPAGGMEMPRGQAERRKKHVFI